MAPEIQRKLTTILAADAEGYSRAMATDEPGTIADLRASRSVFSRFIERHGGRIANTAGDGLIAEFSSVVEAVQCAVEVQSELQGRSDAALRFRIGIHLGDVIVDGADLLGDGVNLAARLQTMAEPGGILISRQVYDQVHGKLTVGFQHLGERQARNMPEEVDVYRVSVGGAATEAPVKLDTAVFLSPPHTAASPKQQTSTPDTPPPAPAPEPTAAPQHQSPPAMSPDITPANTDGRLNPIVRNLLVIAGIAVASNLASGGGIWAHWAVLPAAVAYGFYMAPRLAKSGLDANRLRVLIGLAALVFINLITWSGTFWAIWPMIAAVAFLFLGGSGKKAGG